MKTVLSVLSLIACLCSYAQTITVGYDLHFEQNAEVLGKSNATYPNGYPLNESGYVRSLIVQPDICHSWTSTDYWDTFGAYLHAETDYDCADSVPHILSEPLPDLVILSDWNYTTNLLIFARATSDTGSPTTFYHFDLDSSLSVWIDWSGVPFAAPRITYEDKPGDFSKWMWGGSVNPNYVEPLVLKKNRRHHK